MFDDYSEDDYDSMDSGVGSMGSSFGGSAGDFEGVSFGGDGGDDRSPDDFDSEDSGFVPTTVTPSTVTPSTAPTFGVLTPEAQRTRNLATGVDYLSPSLLTDLTMPRSVTPQQAIAGMGIQGISPYRPDAVTFASGQPRMTIDPSAGVSPVVFNMGRTQQQMDDRNFLERAGEAIGDRLGFTFQNQRAGLYDPMFDRYQTVSGARTMAPDDDRFGTDPRTYMASTRLDKVSDNPFTDMIANALAYPFASTVDTATYMPATGGEEYTFQSAGGLLGLLQDPTLRLTSEIEAEAEAARLAGMDGGGDQPLIIPQEVVAEDDEEAEDELAFTEFTPREFEYQPFTSKFYTIPSRFTQPTSLLG